MKLKSISLKDKAIFTQHLKYSRHELAVYSFADIFIWKGLFDISWVVIDGNPCIFFKDNFGTFLYLPPLGKKFSPEAVLSSYNIAASLNKNPEVTRIENIEEEEIASYRGLGFKCSLKSQDYLCLRKDLVSLSGNKLKSQRWARNYFLNHYKFEFSPLLPKDKQGCLSLYDSWMGMRKAGNSGHVYQGMMEDSRIALQVALANYSVLNLKGTAVRINKKIRGFTFGYELNKDTFCILYEVTDLSVKGLAQFIFSRNCAELKGYKYINVMDDSGLENLKKVKLAYKPVKLVPAYIAKK
ncbi:MAG: phosphatidylglycerol lysyltransferase domain-containing protein [Candidatus Omnitrophica bacterium]|nr:phosphatidylglycerol lysyltransferase domain-containing protein [Candidatus Omnitrophota bacterium]